MRALAWGLLLLRTGGRKSCAAWIVLAGVLGIASPLFAAGTTYYIDNRTDSNCSDGGPHSIGQPWCTLTPVNKIRVFGPGDRILLARGGFWNQQLTV